MQLNKVSTFTIMIPVFLVVACQNGGIGDLPFPLSNPRYSVQNGNLTSTSNIAVPLSTNGRYVVDGNNNRFKLKGVNWYGASDTKQVVAGLDKQPIAYIIGLIKEWGFNAVRLPFSNMMIHDANPVSPDAVSANPQFIGLTPIQVYDKTVEALTNAGIVVVINNHTTISEWCCNYDYNGQWYHTGSAFAYNQTPEMWKNDWITMATRYQNNKMVAAADLRNEVRTMRSGDTYLPNSPNWSSRNQDDWRQAAADAGSAILKVNPDILIIVEGINWWGLIPALGSGERPHLKPVRDLQVHLRIANKLVYAAHNYGYIGPKHNGDDATSGGNIKYRDMDLNTFRNTITDEWGYVVTTEMYYTAPVWVSEFGADPNTIIQQDKDWFKNLVDYLIERDMDFAFWPLNGNDGWGLVTADWSQVRRDDWRYEHMNRLIGFNGKTDAVTADHFSSLAIGNGDDNASTNETDWLVGASKGTCPDSQRLNGLSQNSRALCTDTKFAPLFTSWSNVSVQAVYETSDRSHNTGDWAGGFTKYECPANYYTAGFTRHWWGTSGVMCVKSNRPLTGACRTVWFDRGDNRTSSRGGDWAAGSYKGQCSDTEYVAGIAQRNGSASALLCCATK